MAFWLVEWRLSARQKTTPVHSLRAFLPSAANVGPESAKSFSSWGHPLLLPVLGNLALLPDSVLTVTPQPHFEPAYRRAHATERARLSRALFTIGSFVLLARSSHRRACARHSSDCEGTTAFPDLWVNAGSCRGFLSCRRRLSGLLLPPPALSERCHRSLARRRVAVRAVEKSEKSATGARCQGLQ